jgi:invasion protein IalB
MRVVSAGLLCAGLVPVPALAAKKSHHHHKTAPAPAAAGAVDPGPAQSLGSAGAWTAYMAQNKAGKVCYLVSQAEKAEPPARGRSVMAMVTHRTQDGVSNVVSFDTGIPLNENDDVALDVGGSKFTLFAKNDTAWAATAELDKTIVGALAKGKQAVVKANPKKGHATVDAYSLSGFGKALALIDKACGVKR